MSSSIADNPSLKTIEALSAELLGAPLKRQLAILNELVAMGEAAYPAVMAFMQAQGGEATIAIGRAYQLLYGVEAPSVQSFLTQHFPTGVVPLDPACQVDYTDVQRHLAAQEFEAADRLTLQKMCEIAGPMAVKRKWLYFTEVTSFPVLDLQTLDRLWVVYSEGKFGFSIQRDLWLGVGKDWERLWPKIAWKNENVWTRYPGEFIWNLSAPIGHLPLSNQLRGVRAMEALLQHPAWTA
jgi:hypothetical protein